ncbi:MAG: hypothetical protein AB1716_15880 [Planctomycetota bacterium]
MQPDFNSIFRDYFDSQPDPLSYALRGDANFRHDAIFLSALLHDATFRLADVERVADRLTLRLDRDRWERPSDGPQGLLGVSSLLTFSGVHRIRWSFHFPNLPTSANELQVVAFSAALILPLSHVKCVLRGFRWMLRVRMKTRCEVRLQDAP